MSFQRLTDLPVELLYEVQLDALSASFPHVSRHFYRVFKLASTSFHAEYILRRVMADGRRGIVARALRYPLCATEVFDALCRHSDFVLLQNESSELPRRLFKFDPRPASQWTIHDRPLPFLKFLRNHPTIRGIHPFIDDYGLTQAADAVFVPLIIFLLECGAGYYYRGPTGALLWAAKKGHMKVVQAVLAQYHNVNSRNQNDMTALHCAIEGSNHAILKLLLAEDGVDVNLKGPEGTTALYWAACSGDMEIVELLLAQDDVNVNLEDTSYETPLSMAAEDGYSAIVERLLARGADINSTNIHGETPLLLAARNGYEDVVELLLTREDIDVNAKGKHGQTPLLLAAGKGHEAVVELLRNDKRTIQ